MERKEEVSFETFLALDIRAGTVVRAEAFPEARKPAIKLWIDFGEPWGVRQSSAQLTRRYTREGLVGTKVLAVLNFPPRRIAGFESQCLVLGMTDAEHPGDVVLVRPDDPEAVGWTLA
jgi:tRNA-binding protein